MGGNFTSSTQEIITEASAKKIFSGEDKDGDTLFQLADQLGEKMSNVRQSQIRKIYSEFMRIHLNFKNQLRNHQQEKAVERCKYELRHLKARLVYVKSRNENRSKELAQFCDEFTKLIDAAIISGPSTPIIKGGDLVIDRLKDFFEATLARTKEK